MYLDKGETLICIEVVVTKDKNQHKLMCLFPREVLQFLSLLHIKKILLEYNLHVTKTNAESS
jgi:hypothetical protein